LFNLFISYSADSWDLNPYEIDRSRACIEYTADEISERYKFFNDKAVEELKNFPTLFVTEDEQTTSRIGYLVDIKLRQNTVVIRYEFDVHMPELPIGTIEAIGTEIDLGGWELSRTHWAVKDENLFEILLRRGYITQDQLQASLDQRVPPPPPVQPEQEQQPVILNNTQVFIVHGHDEIAKLDMAAFIKSIGLEPIILHLQPSLGKTIIEKIEAYSNVGFAVVLYTPCDVGAKKGDLAYNQRARQNVVFEHGYLIAKLGRPRVAALVKGQVETPNDISGVVYINFDATGVWQTQLLNEMRAVGYAV